MERRSRIIYFGSATALGVAGIACGALAGGLVGQMLAIVLCSLGFGGVVLLLFLEIGLSEDKERARDAESQRRRRQTERVRKGSDPARARASRRPLSRIPRRPG